MTNRFFNLALALALPAALLAQTGNVSAPRKTLPYVNSIAVQKAENSSVGLSTNPGKLLAKPLRATALTHNVLFDQADDEAKIWGFLSYDLRLAANGVVCFTTDNASSYYMVKDYGREQGVSKQITAATYVGDKIYGYACTFYGYGAIVPYAIVTIDPLTGDYTVVKQVEYTAPLVNDMTYDPVTGKIYAIQYNYDSSDPTKNHSVLYSIEPTTGELTRLADLNYLLWDLSADVNGTLFGIAEDLEVDSKSDDNSFLVKLPAGSVAAGNYNMQRVGTKTLGINVTYQQSMEFDRTTHKLWWLTQAASGNPYIAEVDTTSGTVKLKRQLTGQAQITSLAIPYQKVDNAAPSFPRNMKVVAGAEGANSAVVSWTNPSKNYLNGTLTDLTGVRVYRDGALLETKTGGATGADDSYTDNGITKPGYYTYKLQGYNASGDGVYKEARLWVGKDVPGGASSVVLSASGSKGTLSWGAPKMGKNNGWYDKSSLKFKVVRQPDNVVVAENITDSTLVDNVTAYNGYSYQIISSNNEGTGDTVTSQVVQFGPNVTIPYFDAMSTEGEVNEWQKIDANGDGTTWGYSVDQKAAAYSWSLGPANDYLVSPPLTFKADTKYRIDYTYYSSNWVTADTHDPIYEKMKVFYGQEPTVKGFTTLVKDLGSFHTASDNFLYGKDVFIPKQGTGYLAFNACSDADCGIIYLKNVAIREVTATDVSIKDVQGSATANVNAPYAFGVNVCNEGNAPVSNFTVQILDAETRDVIADTVITQPLAEGATVNYTVSWTPKREGSYGFVAHVALDGDSYPADNDFSKEIHVKVSGAAAQTWLTVNKDDSGDGNMVGWYLPFNFCNGYTKAEIIYLDKEINLRGINLTGVQFLYNSAATFTGAQGSVKISMANTDQSYIQQDESWNVLFVDADFQQVFDGTVSLEAGENTDCPVIVNFDTPFAYNGGNLAVDYETTVAQENILAGNDASSPLWHYCNNYADGDPERYRTFIYRGANSNINITKTGANYWTPFTMFSYTTVDGIQGVIEPQSGLDIHQQGKELVSNKPFASLQVYTVDGKLVRQTANASRVNVDGLHGAYLVRFALGNEKATVKVVIR